MGRTDMLAEILRSAWLSIREVLPSTEDEAGPWLAGFCSAFVLHWVALLAVTYAHCSRTGPC